MLESVKESIINAYEIKSGMSRAKLSHLMDAETWMDANKAVELGFADEVLFKNPATKVDEEETDDDEEDVAEIEEEEKEEDDDEKEKSASFAFSSRKANSSLIEKVVKNPPKVTGIPADQLFKRLNLIK